MQVKRWKFVIPYFNRDKFFSAVRERWHIIMILLEAIEYMLTNTKSGEFDSDLMFCLNVQKMSRIFFVSPDKYYSIYFPFTVEIIDEEVKIRNDDYDIDAMTVSMLKSIFKEPNSRSVKGCSESITGVFEDMDIDMDIDMENKINFIVYNLLTMEPGYIRYDYDPKTHKLFCDNKKGLLHPENHYDINYTQGGTFKIGLYDKLKIDDVIRLLNVEDECLFLSGCSVNKL